MLRYVDKPSQILLQGRANTSGDYDEKRNFFAYLTAVLRPRLNRSLEDMFA